ncbi:hypothetical protein ABZ702_06550 [Streptomyces cyaneofuscatus]|uniref:hypothetical protein n=1 Tax=Streptomyces cyaneofuscatus TaxID=66883 RepID=UPI0033E60702
MGDTFGDNPRRPARTDGIGRSQRELQDRASFGHTPAAGCLLAIPASLLLWAGLIAAAREILGVIA